MGMYHMLELRIRLPLVCAMFGSFAALHGYAASAADTTPVEEAGPLQEITVTATRREESLSKVPISVTALTQDAICLLYTSPSPRDCS